MKLINIIVTNYRSYWNARANKQESHVLRLIIFVIVAFFVAVSVGVPPIDITTLMVTGLAILTGFTFTALFSDHALAEAGLPMPSTESDRIEIAKLAKLSHNFRARSEYFITLSVLNVCVLILIGIGIDPAIPARWILEVSGTRNLFPIDIIRGIYYVAARILLSTGIFISTLFFLENLYTFYRLTETTLAILNARRAYLAVDRQL